MMNNAASVGSSYPSPSSLSPNGQVFPRLHFLFSNCPNKRSTTSHSKSNRRMVQSPPCMHVMMQACHLFSNYDNFQSMNKCFYHECYTEHRGLRAGMESFQLYHFRRVETHFCVFTYVCNPIRHYTHRERKNVFIHWILPFE